MAMPDIIGWGASVVLLATIGFQVWRQWAAGTSKGVSKWLFIGQIAASLGFTIYSGLVGNLVFTVTNVLLLASAVVGLVIVFVHRRREGGAAA